MDDLIIKLNLDRTPAESSGRAFHQAEQQRIMQTATVQQTVMQRARDEHGRFVAGAVSGNAQVSKSAEGIGFSIESAFGSLKSFAAGMTGLGSTTAIVSAIVGSWKEAERSAYDATKMVQDYRQALLELEALKGNMGGTTAAIQEDIKFRAQTLQTAEQSRAFQLSALGVGASAVDTPLEKRRISDAEWQKALVLGGRFQATETGDARTHGLLVGTLANLSKQGETGENLFRREQQLYKVMQPGGFEFASGARQFAALTPLIQSGSYKEMEAAALASAFSTVAPESAGDMVQQFTRATLGGIGKKGRVMVEGGTTRGDYYKSLGITPESTKQIKTDQLPFEIANRITEDIKRQQQTAEGRGEQFSEKTYLSMKGFQAQEEINTLMAYKGLKESGALGSIMKLARPEAMPTVAEATQPIEKAQSTDPMFMARKAEMAGELSKVAVGADPKNEVLTRVRQMAFEKMKAEGEMSGTFEDRFVNQGYLGAPELLFGYRRRINEQAQSMLVGEGRKLGLDLQPRRVDPKTGIVSDDTSFRGDENLFQMASKIRAKGGDVAPGFGDIQKAAEMSLQASQKFQDAAERFAAAMPKPPQPQPMPGKPGVATRH